MHGQAVIILEAVVVLIGAIVNSTGVASRRSAAQTKWAVC